MKYMLLNIIVFWISCLNNSDGMVARPIRSDYLMEIHREELQYKALYDSTISFIKYHEGFRAHWYDDNGYACIGYGQRKMFYKGTITAPITEKQGHDILVNSFNSHLALARLYYPKLSRTKALAVAHMSFCMGIGRLKQLKVITDTTLHPEKLLKLPHKQNRQFEIDVFNKGYGIL